MGDVCSRQFWRDSRNERISAESPFRQGKLTAARWVCKATGQAMALIGALPTEGRNRSREGVIFRHRGGSPCPQQGFSPAVSCESWSGGYARSPCSFW